MGVLTGCASMKVGEVKRIGYQWASFTAIELDRLGSGTLFFEVLEFEHISSSPNV